MQVDGTITVAIPRCTGILLDAHVAAGRLGCCPLSGVDRDPRLWLGGLARAGTWGEPEGTCPARPSRPCRPCTQTCHSVGTPGPTGACHWRGAPPGYAPGGALSQV